MPELIDFIIRNEGQIVGSFLGALLAAIVAIYAAKKSHFYAMDRDDKKLDFENKITTK